MYQKQIIEKALPIVAAMYSRKFDVSVRIGGSDAFTDGSSITIPAIPDDYPHPESLYGFLAHEAAHVKFTNFSTVRKITSDIQKHIFNVLEDGRIENRMIQEFPGSRVTLDQAGEYFNETDRFKTVTSDDSELAIFTGFILYWMRSQWRGQTFLSEHFVSAQAMMNSTFPKGVNIKLDALLKQAPKLSSSQEVLKLTNKIVKMLEDEAKDDEPEDNSENSESDQSSNEEGGSENASEGNDGSDSDDSGNNEDESGSSESEGDDDDSSQDQGESSDKSDSSQKEALKKLLNCGDEGEAVMDVFDQIKDSLEEAASNNPDIHAVQSIPCAGGEAPRVNEVSHGNHSSNDSVIKAVSSSIRQQLLRMVQANHRSKITVRDRGRNISGRHICKVVSGSSRIFEHKTQRPNPNTAVHLLVDASGSMNGERMTVANDSAKALGLALETLPKVNPAISYFPGCSREVAVGVKHGESVKNNLHNINMAPNGGTPMADGIWYAIDQMHSIREDRKILIVVTDGAPHNGSAVKYAIKLAEKAGIEVMAIGIQSDAVAHYFENHVVIKNVSELQDTLFGLMKDSLVAA